MVLCHAEGYKLGRASNHGDVLHWFGRHGKTMDDFRSDVLREMEADMLTEQEIRALVREEIKRAEAELGLLPPSDWAAENLKDAVLLGITDGSRPQGHATRQEVALMVRAAMK